MARLFFITIMILGILLQSGRQLALYGWYLIHQDYLTENFCLNVAQPELECHAKCYLATVLEEAPEDTTPNPVLPVSPLEESLIVKILPRQPSWSLRALFSLRENTLPDVLSHYSFHPVFDLFHPPKHRC